MGTAEEAVTKTMLIHHSAETLQKRQVLTRLWVVAVIVWSVLRTIIIWVALGSYGFNPWIYLSIDLVCATIDAFTTPRMVLYFIDSRYKLAVKWFVVSLVAFIIPDIYIFVGTRSLPGTVILVLCSVIFAMIALASISIFRKVRRGRVELALAGAVAATPGHG